MCDRLIHFYIVKELSEIEKKCIKSVYSHNQNYAIVYHIGLASSAESSGPKVSNFVQEIPFPEELNFPNSQQVKTDKLNEHNLPYYKTLISYFYGGFNLDNDMLCLQSLDIILETFNSCEDKQIVLFRSGGPNDIGNFIPDVIVSKPKNKILENSVENKISFWESKSLNPEDLGLEDLNKAIILPSHIFQEIKLGPNEVWENFIPKILSSICVKLGPLVPNFVWELGNSISLTKFGTFGPNTEETIYYINLKNRPERRISFLAAWSRIFKNIIRFEAKPHQKIGNLIINGCGISHYEATKLALKDNNYAIILEDDAIPTDNFVELFPKIMSYVKSNFNDFDLLNFGGPTIMNLTHKIFNPKIINENILGVDATCASHFVIYTKGILHYFYKFFAEALFRPNYKMDQDSYFKEELELRKVITYPLLSYQNNTFISDVIQMYRSGDYFAQCVKQIEFALQKRKEGIEGDLLAITPKELYRH
jgi:hypothetical protein